MEMKSITLLLFLLQIIINGVQSADYGIYKCRNSGNFSSTDLKTLETALNSLAGNLTNNLEFVTTSAGENTSAQVNAAALCRGYIGLEACRTCVRDSIPFLRRSCPNQKEAVVWYSDCMVRYSDRKIVGVLDSWTSDKISTSAKVSDVGEFDKAFTNLTTRLQAEAAGGDSLLKLAVGNVTYGRDALVIYAMMQCTPDLSSEECNTCLNATIIGINDCCRSEVAARVFYPNCFLRYANEKFYDTSGKKDKKSKTTRLIYILVPVACVSGVLIGIGIWFLCIRKRRKDGVTNIEASSFSSLLVGHRQASTHDTVGMEIVTVQSLQFDLGTIEVATNYFSLKNKIGKGGFGMVYKGVLQNGQEVAVKRLSETSGQGVDEFVNEAVLVAKLQHRNLVRLLGFCHDAKEKILIYEYVPNKSLDYFLFDPVKHGHLDWATRWKIIGVITRGMLYLHEDSRLRIIHRDLKASNILLDQDMNAKIADFGLARTFGVDQTDGNTKKIAGTLGYMSPEYAMHGHFSVKSDVFSFGVIVLEIISGRRNSSFYQQDEVEDLLLFAWKQWTGGKPLALIDPRLGESYPKNEATRCINIGLLCVQEDADARPSMASILNMLNNSSITLPDPKKPPYFLSKGLFSDISGDADKSIPTVSSQDDSSAKKMSPR